MFNVFLRADSLSFLNRITNSGKQQTAGESKHATRIEQGGKQRTTSPRSEENKERLHQCRRKTKNDFIKAGGKQRTTSPRPEGEGRLAASPEKMLREKEKETYFTDIKLHFYTPRTDYLFHGLGL